MNSIIVTEKRLFCTFRLDGQLFGVDMHDVKEVTAELACTRVAHAPNEVLGLVNIRGHIYLALDLRRLLGMPDKWPTSESRLILFKSTVGNAFGVVVDETSEIQSAGVDQIEPFNPEDATSMTTIRRVDLISAVCKLPSELLVLINPCRLLPIVEQLMMESP